MSHKSPVCRSASAAAAFLTGIAALLAVPPASAAPLCETAGTGELPEVAYDGEYTVSIVCKDLTDGLKLTVGSGAKVGAAGAPVDEDALDLNALGAGADSVAIVNSGSLYSNVSGIAVVRDGTGILKAEHKAGGRIVGYGEEGKGIVVTHTGQENAKTEGIHVISSGDIDISKAPDSGKIGIEATTVDSAAGSTIPIRIEVKGGRIDVSDSGGAPEYGTGVVAFQHAKGDIDVTVGPGAWIGGNGKHGVHTQLQSASVGNVIVTHEGRIHAVGAGIIGWSFSTSTAAGTGDITFRTAPGSEIRTAFNPLNNVHPARGMDVTLFSTASSGDITVVHNGLIESGHEGIFAATLGTGDITVETGETGRIVTTGTRSGTGAFTKYITGIDASLRGAGRDGDITVTHRGVITAGDAGIAAAIAAGSIHDYLNTETTRDATSNGTIGVTTAEGSRVASESDGIFVWHNGGGDAAGQGTFSVTVRGRVTGGGAGYAGIHIAAKGDAKGNGGTVTVGPRAYAGAESGVAVRVDANAGPVTVILEKDEYGLAGHVESRILNADSTATVFKTRAGESGAETALSAGDRVDMRGKTNGVYDRVHRTELETITGGHQFREQSQTRFYHDRARVYEALPSVLLDLNRQAPGFRAGGGQRVQGRLDAGEGKRRAAASATGQGYRGVALSWDMRRRGAEAGFALPLDDRLTLETSVRRVRGEATVKEGGRIEASGLGIGLSAAYDDGNGLYFDVRMSRTRFSDIDLFSDTPGRDRLDLSGTGLAAGFEVGKRMAREGMDLTPRGGLTRSSVKVGAFDDVPGIEGSGVVSPDGAQSLIGGLGVLAEFGGAEESSARGFVSLDLEHEFSSGREVVASGAKLSSKAEAVWARLGAGGSLELDSSGQARLSGEGYYAAAGSGNSGYGGSVSLVFRF